MTRKRTNRRSLIQGYDPSSREQISQRLQAEQTGPEGVLYPDGRPNIGRMRDAERDAVAHLQVPHVMLPNPSADAPFDRTQPLSRIAKNEAFGFQVQPDRLIDLPPGDAGAGSSVYRRGHIFSRLDNPATGIVAGNPFDKSIGFATYRSSDCRPRLWHVSFFGIAVQRVANLVPLAPLTESEILSEQLDPVVTGAVAVTPRFVPAISQMKGRVMVFDESGQRFFDVDVLGNRSFDIYAWGVTAFVLMPGNFGDPDQTSYQVNPGSDGNLPQQSLAGIVEDSLIGIRIIPIVINSTQSDENRTIGIVTGNVAPTRVPIPPGAKKVQIISTETPTIAATYRIDFDAGDDGTFAGRSDLGVIDINVGQTRSDDILIPNAVQIIFTPLVGAPGSAGWSLVFTVESQ
jgi:hypothetical protein